MKGARDFNMRYLSRSWHARVGTGDGSGEGSEDGTGDMLGSGVGIYQFESGDVCMGGFATAMRKFWEEIYCWYTCESNFYFYGLIPSKLP